MKNIWFPVYYWICWIFWPKCNISVSTEINEIQWILVKSHWKWKPPYRSCAKYHYCSEICSNMSYVSLSFHMKRTTWFGNNWGRYFVERRFEVYHHWWSPNASGFTGPMLSFLDSYGKQEQGKLAQEIITDIESPLTTHTKQKSHNCAF